MYAQWTSTDFLHIDRPLLIALLVLASIGLLVLYSAGGQDVDLIERQMLRLTMGFSIMMILAQIRIQYIINWIPWLYLAGVLLLIAVLIVGEISKGSQRWLDLGIFRFQPSEMMKLAVPLMVTWYLSQRPLPPSYKNLFVATMITLIPVLLVAKQPDLGTALLIASAGMFVLLLSGISFKLVFSVIGVGVISAPILWHFLHEYQRQRIHTFLNPEENPLSTGYHIIQSTIAIGSGGVYGKGWLNGTQSHLEFLPERTTDFILAVLSEEFGLLGVLTLVSVYAFILTRGIYIASQAQGSFSRLLAGSLTLTFFVYVFVNMGMVIGLLPVVGLPLPLISYGGTSLVTVMAGFGLLMAIHTHRRLLSG